MADLNFQIESGTDTDDHESSEHIHDDYYKLLGVTSTARLREIKKQFRLLQRTHHPDRSRSDTTRSMAAKLNRAYQTLSNPLSRLEYDLQHGVKEKNADNLQRLQQLKQRKAEKVRENLSASAQRSREIEDGVTRITGNSIKLKQCGLIIVKASYGLMMEESPALPPQMELNATAPPTPTATPTPTPTTTIDVTDALQCMVCHRGASGGYIEIADNFDKSQLDGFYDPCPNRHRDEYRYLQIEYMFDRHYHYVVVNNLEYVCVPNQAHIIHLIHDEHERSGRVSAAGTGVQTTSSGSSSSAARTHSVSVTSPISNLSLHDQNRDNNLNRNSVVSAAAEIISLPSGKRGFLHRPSLAGLKKIDDIRRINDIHDERDKSDAWTMIKWSVGLMTIGAIGGLAYYYSDKMQRLRRDRNTAHAAEND